jgi:hypothetical protein
MIRLPTVCSKITLDFLLGDSILLIIFLLLNLVRRICTAQFYETLDETHSSGSPAFLLCDENHKDGTKRLQIRIRTELMQRFTQLPEHLFN